MEHYTFLNMEQWKWNTTKEHHTFLNMEQWKWNTTIEHYTLPHFFPPNSSRHLRSDAHQSQIIGGDADVDHIQTIGGIYPPRVLAPLVDGSDSLHLSSFAARSKGFLEWYNWR